MKNKIGRNDPCPCGSGKKYKKCCLGNDGVPINKFAPETEIKPYERLVMSRFDQELIDHPELLKEMSEKLKETKIVKNFPAQKSFEDFISGLWTSKKLKALSTEAIIAKLASMGVEFKEPLFRQQVQNYVSAIQLAEDHYYTQKWHAKGLDEDFIWLAIVELWIRLTPEQVNVEMINHLIMDGYDNFRDGSNEDAFEGWTRAWTMIKSLVPAKLRSVEEADKFAGKELEQSFSSWCQDFADLKIEGLEDSVYEKRIIFCQDFLMVFPNSDKSVLRSVLAGEAECYAAIGKFEAADKTFEDLIAMDPNNSWGYIRWGDTYCALELYTKFPSDYEKAKKIYRIGIAKCTKKVDALKERLEDTEISRA